MTTKKSKSKACSTQKNCKPCSVVLTPVAKVASLASAKAKKTSKKSAKQGLIARLRALALKWVGK